MLKKIALVSLCVLIVLMPISGCSSKTKTLDIEAFCDKVLSEIPYDDELTILPERVAAEYYDLSFEGLEEFCIYVSGTAATANELAVMKLANDDAVKSAEQAVNARVSEQINTYGNYNPAEVFRLESALILKKDGYLLLSVSNYNDDVEKAFNDSLK